MDTKIEKLFDALNKDETEKALTSLENDPSLLHQTAIAGRTPLHQAAFNGNRTVVEFLITHDANVNALTEHGWSPLFYACAPLDESIGVLLIEKGCNVSVRNEDGFTALHLAADYGKLVIAKAMIDKGLDVNIKDNSGRTALDCALSVGWEPMADFLRHNGAKSGNQITD